MTFYDAAESLKTLHGEENLWAYDQNENRVPGEIEDVIKTGWPPHVFDCIEATLDCLEERKASECEAQLNNVFDIHQSHWRIVNRRAILVDSQYLQEQIVVPAITNLRDLKFQGALEEFREALNCLSQGETKDAVINAHKSVESTMKAILGVTVGRFGQLIRQLIDGGHVPKYYEDFLVHFENILLASGKERNLEGRGHGQGLELISVDPALGKLACNLSSVIILFLTDRYIETVRPPAKGFIQETKEVTDDLPF